MLWWGIKLVQTTWYQSIAEFPIVSAGLAYVPVPLGGLIMVLFVIERLLTQVWFLEQTDRDDEHGYNGIGRATLMDAFVLIGSFTVFCLMGMPVAYALGLAVHRRGRMGRNSA